MTGAAHESAKICHSNNSANLLGDALCQEAMAWTCIEAELQAHAIYNEQKY